MIDPRNYDCLHRHVFTHENTSNVPHLSRVVPEGAKFRMGVFQLTGMGDMRFFSISITVPLQNGEDGRIFGVGTMYHSRLSDDEQAWKFMVMSFTSGEKTHKFNESKNNDSSWIKNEDTRKKLLDYTEHCINIAKEYSVHVYKTAVAEFEREEASRLEEIDEIVSQSLKF